MFDSKADEGIFLGCSQSRKSYIYNKRLIFVEELVHVTFNESYLKTVKKGILFHNTGRRHVI